MNAMPREEHLVHQLVTYTVEINGHFVVVEHVPARVDTETGERFFAPETVERLQQIVWGKGTPTRTIKTPVFEFAA
jgi:YgiT-type zinc finger domain-containing protein